MNLLKTFMVAMLFMGTMLFNNTEAQAQEEHHFKVRNESGQPVRVLVTHDGWKSNSWEKTLTDDSTTKITPPSKWGKQSWNWRVHVYDHSDRLVAEYFPVNIQYGNQKLYVKHNAKNGWHIERLWKD